MRKLRTLALALVALTVLTGFSVGQGAQQKDKQKSPPKSAETKPTPTTRPDLRDDLGGDPRKSAETKPTPTTPPAPTAKNSAHATEQVMTGTVTKVNDKAQTFAVTANGKEVNFSGKNLKAPFPKVGDLVDVTYTQNPGDPPAATTVRGSKSNGSFRVASPPPTKTMTGTVTELNEKAQTFTVKTANGEHLTFSAEKMKGDFTRSTFKVGDFVDVTYTHPQNPGDPPAATTVRGSKSNGSFRVASPPPTKMVTGTVTKVDEKARTFIIKTANGEQFTFSAKEIPPPKKDEQVAVTYIQTTPGGSLEARRYMEVRTQQGRAEDKDDSPKVVTGEVTKVDKEAQTFTIRTKEGKEVTFSRAKRIAYGEDSRRDLLQVGSIIDVGYTQNPGEPPSATTVKGHRSNASFRVADDAHSAQQMTGKVLRVDAKHKTFTVMAKGEEVTFDGKGLRALPDVGKIIDIAYTPNPGGPPVAMKADITRSNPFK